MAPIGSMNSLNPEKRDPGDLGLNPVREGNSGEGEDSLDTGEDPLVKETSARVLPEGLR